jgi:hypothetical protein
VLLKYHLKVPRAALASIVITRTIGPPTTFSQTRETARASAVIKNHLKPSMQAGNSTFRRLKS